MSFQRLAIAEGTYLLRDSMLHPLFEVKVKKMRDLSTPRYSGVGLPSTQMPNNARNLLIFLALCHTVRVEQNPETRESSIISLLPLKKSDLGKRMREGFKKLRSNKMQPPSKEWTFRRRESAVLSAQEAVSAVNRGSLVKTSHEYEYQVRSFTSPNVFNIDISIERYKLVSNILKIDVAACIFIYPSYALQ